MRIIIKILIITIGAIITSCHEKGNVNLGGNLRLIHSANFVDMTIVDEDNTVIIYGHILDFAFDSNFIIAAQRPRDSVPECNGTIKEIKFEESELAFKKSIFIQYWIINKKEEFIYSLDSNTMLAKYSNVYGPYNKEEYLQKREKLKVPKSLKLKD